MSNLTLVTPPATEPVTLAEAKLYARVDYTDDDTLFTSLIKTARRICEVTCRRAFITQTWKLTLERFPNAYPINYYPFYSLERQPNQLWGRIYLPNPPLQSVSTIVYTDTNGSLTTLATSEYKVLSGGDGQGLVTPSYGKLFPAARYEVDAVNVTYVAGYGSAAAVPEEAKTAIGRLIHHLYWNREAIAAGTMSEVPYGIEGLLDPLYYGSYV